MPVMPSLALWFAECVHNIIESCIPLQRPDTSVETICIYLSLVFLSFRLSHSFSSKRKVFNFVVKSLILFFSFYVQLFFSFNYFPRNLFVVHFLPKTQKFFLSVCLCVCIRSLIDSKNVKPFRVTTIAHKKTYIYYLICFYSFRCHLSWERDQHLNDTRFNLNTHV